MEMDSVEDNSRELISERGIGEKTSKVEGGAGGIKWKKREREGGRN